MPIRPDRFRRRWMRISATNTFLALIVLFLFLIYLQLIDMTFCLRSLKFPPPPAAAEPT